MVVSLRAPWLVGMVALLAAHLTAPVAAMSLLDAYQSARQLDATTRAARAAVVAGDERITQAKAQLYPNIALTAAYMRNDLSLAQQGTTTPEQNSNEKYPSHNATLVLRQPLFRKALGIGVDQAHSQRDEVGSSLAFEESNLGTRVAEAYMQNLLATDQLLLVRAQLQATATQLDAARKQFAAGSGTRTDIDEAQARLDMVRADELEAIQQREYAQRRLAQFVADPTVAASLHTLDTQRLQSWQPASHSLDEWLAQMEDNSPEIRVLKARTETARLEVQKAQTGHLPTVDAVAQWSRSASENVTTTSSRYTNRAIGVQLNLPLFAGGYVSALTRQALALQEQAQELLDAGRRDLSLRVHTEFRNVTEGRMRIRALEQAAHSASQLAVSSRKSFEGGARTLVDVFNADQNKARTLRDLARARYMYLMACIRLQTLTGNDPENAIADVNALLTPP